MLRVIFHVDPQLGGLNEGLTAFGTLVGSFAGVRFHMTIESFFDGKCAGALFGGVCKKCQPKCIQSIRKRFITYQSTSIRFFSGMLSTMFAQGSVGRKKVFA